MKRSFVRLTVSSVILCWVIGFAILVLYSRSLSWTEEQARRDGVFLAFELLDQVPAGVRADRLQSLREHFSTDLSLVTIADLERLVGELPHAGRPVLHRDDSREDWLFLAFHDGHGALAAGPVSPGIPEGYLPIGLILAILGLPVIAALVVLRVERQLTKVEQASRSLAEGKLNARVDNPSGPSSELAASFNAMAERVERLIRSRDELVQAVSHELGSPLSRLRFHMELLDRHSDAAHEERLNAMTRELDALDELVAELLSYVQSDELVLDQRAFDPTRDLNDLAELARLEDQGAGGVAIDLELPEEATVFADQRLFQRAVENILRNAVCHARDRVLLELTAHEQHVRVAVDDDGPGIPEDLRDKVMAPFYRLDADRDRKTGGAGLGLAIVSRIMQRHGGSLAIEHSRLGGAAVVTLWPRES